VLRAPQMLYAARKQFPSAKLYFWAHDIFAGAGWDKGFQALVDTQATPILVSDWHKAQMYDAMAQVQFRGQVPSRRIYNPIDDALQPDGTPVDKEKMVFFSSPHKGLERTLEVFARFQDFAELRDVRLYVSNPGYFANHNTEGLRNVINLGALPHKDVIAHVRSSLCVFYLNGVFPETFGLVAAESNAVGTPFLSTKIGALPEVGDHPQEFVDVKDNESIIKRIIAWKTQGRPKVLGNPAFRLKSVVRDWLDLFKV
jgi:glycosyltransferase involved in cell wall biosynthesis